MIFDEYRCVDNEFTLDRQITRAQARDNLVEVLHSLLAPLYERYSFFPLSLKLVTEEVNRTTGNRF
jgi:hypothetical protein